MFAQQCDFLFHRERTARQQQQMLRRHRSGRRVDGPDQEPGLVEIGELTHMLASDGEKDSLETGSGRRGRRHVGNPQPVVVGLLWPARPAQLQDRHSGHAGGLGRVRGYGLGERMSGVDDDLDPVVGQPVPQTSHTAETADANGAGG